ncbi:hypothetical protein ZWY2020_052197 [Hordeum vulgare]|nr:hypothetical protein ZWY2020_052197 [Hordeum vulgare]
MHRNLGDGEPRPKRRAPLREAEREAEPRRPSPSSSRRESELPSSSMKGKADTGEEAASWREGRLRPRSPDKWQRGEDRSPPRSQRSRSPVRSGRGDASPPRSYTPRGANLSSLRLGRAGGQEWKRVVSQEEREEGWPAVQWGFEAGVASLPPATPPPAVTAPGLAPRAVLAVCFNCVVKGHYHVDCKQPPACYKCKSSEYPALLCPMRELEDDLALYGHALDDFGYYQMEIPETRTTSSFTTLISLTVNISVSDVDPLAVAVLDPVWMQLRGLPSIAKQAKVIRKMSCLLGKILEIDEASLFRPVVRAKVLTHDSSKLQTTVRIFFNRTGYNIRISVEDMGPLAAGSEAPDTGPPGPLVDGDAAKAPTRPSVDLRGHHPPTMRMMMRHQPCSPTLRLAWASLPWSSRLRWGRTRLCGSRRTRRSPVARCCHPLRTLPGRATRAAWDWRFARLPPPAEVLRWLSALP